VRGEINLDLADVVLDRDFGIGGVASDDGDIELARSTESVEDGLAEIACSLGIQGLRDHRPA